MNLWIVLLTGLTTGGLACLAMQGGLLASVIANQKKTDLVQDGSQAKPTSFDFLDWAPVAMFLSSKLVSHVILGFLLGSLGSVVTLNLTSRLVLQAVSALFMFATAMNLLNVHPIFRYVAFTPPQFARKLIRGTAKSHALFAPAILGFLTIFIPCGVTQAMEVIAVNSGNPIQGALIMGAFVIGTMPIFATIGIATAKFSEVWSTWFLRVAAAALIVMSVISVNGILQVVDSPYTLQRLGPKLVQLLPPYDSNTAGVAPADPNVTVESGVQQASITIGNGGYTPRKFTVRQGVPVQLKVSAGEVYSCATSFTFREFGINAFVKPNTDQIFNFTPTKKGIFTFACSMGMYSGQMEVI